MVRVSLHDMSYQEQLKAIVTPLAEADLVALDRSGVGDGIIEMMPPLVAVMPVVIVAGSRYSRFEDGSVTIGKQALISGVLEAVSRGRLMVDATASGRADLKYELAAFQTRIGRRGRARLDAAARRHDDLVIALELAALATRICRPASPRGHENAS